MQGVSVPARVLPRAGNMVFKYCSVSGCLTSIKQFSHTIPTTGGTSMEVPPVCDIANKEIVWVESYFLGTGDERTYSIWRSSITGANLRRITSFPLLGTAESAIANRFPVGRTDRFIFTRRSGTTVQLYSVSTTTANDSPMLLGSGDSTGPIDPGYGRVLANDTYLVWTAAGASYRAPLQTGLGNGAPPTFYYQPIITGILDNHHFYGFFENMPNGLHWCVPPSCSPTVLSSSLSDAALFTQDAGAIYWAVQNPGVSAGFSVWKVAKQPY